MHISIQDFRCPSWNMIWSANTWQQRHALATRVHQWVRVGLNDHMDDLRLFNVPVAIMVIAQFSKQPIDADNVLIKPVIDGLKSFVIEDDDLAFVASSTGISCIGPVDSIEIFIKPAGTNHQWSDHDCSGRWLELINLST